MIYSLLKQNVKSRNAKRRRQRERWKNNNMSNQQKSNFAAHFFCIFLCRCFARLQRKTSRNFLITRFTEEMSYVFLFTFFPLSLIFIFLFSHRRYKISCCSSNKKCPLFSFVLLCSFYLALALFLVELRWPVALLFLFLCLSLSLFSKFVDMTINLNLTL